MGEAISAVREKMECDKVVSSDFDNFLFGSIPYGQTQRFGFEINSIKGRKTRKYLHLVLYRMESGNYELIYYIL